MAGEKNRYVQIIERVFLKYYRKGASEVPFARTDIIETAAALEIPLPKNLGDIIYSFRYRAALPAPLPKKQKKVTRGSFGLLAGTLHICPDQRSQLFPQSHVGQDQDSGCDAGYVSKYSFDDEQALLAKIRYNRIIDIFTGVTCYSLQNHLRTTLTDIGQVETDEIYVGIDKQGAHYVFPVQAKGGTDKIGAVQIEQDFVVCAEKFPDAVGRPIAAQFMDDETIVLFEFVQTEEGFVSPLKDTIAWCRQMRSRRKNLKNTVGMHRKCEHCGSR